MSNQFCIILEHPKNQVLTNNEKLAIMLATIKKDGESHLGDCEKNIYKKTTQPFCVTFGDLGSPKWISGLPRPSAIGPRCFSNAGRCGKGGNMNIRRFIRLSCLSVMGLFWASCGSDSDSSTGATGVNPGIEPNIAPIAVPAAIISRLKGVIIPLKPAAINSNIVYLHLKKRKWSKPDFQ